MLHVSSNESTNQAEKIFSLIKRGESGIAMCYPTCRIHYNLTRYLSDKKLLRQYSGLLYRNTFFLVIQLTQDETNDSFLEKVKKEVQSKGITVDMTDTLSTMCERIILSGKDPYFFILNTQDVVPQSLSKILTTLYSECLRNARVKTLIFFEENILGKKLSPLLSHFPNFLQNILLFPFYTKGEMEHFIEEVAKEYQLHIDTDLKEKLRDQCGGSLWITKGTLRFMRDNGEKDIKKIANSSQVKMRIQLLLNMLTKDEKFDLANLCYGNKEKISEANRDYFLQIDLVKQHGNEYLLTIPLLQEYLLPILAADNLKISPNEKIVFRGKELQNKLTVFELRLLRALLKKKGQLITREKLAEDIWGDDTESYSDWAIDKLISRLRKSLQEIGLPPTIITTRKRQGFLIS